MRVARRRWVHVLTLLLTWVVMVAGVLLGTRGTVAATSTRPAFDLYQSSEFGYLFWWDAGEWQVINQSAVTGSDEILLENKSTGALVSIGAVTEPGVTVTACLDTILESLQNDDGVTRFDVLASPGDPAFAIGFKAPFAATAEMVIGYDDGFTVASRESCIALGVAGQILIVSEWTDAAAYNARAFDEIDGNTVVRHPVDRFGSNSLLNSLVLPRAVWQFGEQTTFPAGPILFARPQLFLQPDGEELGIFTLVPLVCRSNPDEPLGIVVENTGAGPLPVEPRGFLAWTTGSTAPAPPGQWLLPSGKDGSVTIQPGQSAVLLVQFDDPDAHERSDWNLFYAPYRGVFLDLGPLNRCGAQGGGAAPVLIDIENE